MTNPLRLETWDGRRLEDMDAAELRHVIDQLVTRFRAIEAWYQKRLRTTAVLSLDEAMHGPSLGPSTGGADGMRPPTRLIVVCALVVFAAALVLLEHFGAFR